MHVPEPLTEEGHDVAVVEGVEHHATVAPRLHQTQAAEETQLVRHGGFRHANQSGEIADAELTVRQRVEDTHPRGIAERPEGLGEVCHDVLSDERLTQFGNPRRVEVNDVAEVWNI